MAKTKSASKSPPMTAAKRKALPAKKMGLPDLGKYPVDTPARAANAKARVSQMLEQGKISAADAKKVIAKADKVLGDGKKKPGLAGPAEILKMAKKRAGGKLPPLKPVAKKPHPGMGKKKATSKKR